MSENWDAIFLIGLATFVKILLLWTRHSTEFEVHRNWLAITYSLPLEEWYYEKTSRWPLNQPPFFAWFEWCLSQIAAQVDPKMLDIGNLEYASKRTILFQRVSVICADIVLCYAAFVWHGICCPQTRRLPRLFQPIVLVALILNPGLLLVDHIHFQYNGMLAGIMLLAMARIYQGQALWGTFWFSVLLNLKQVYVYAAPAFLIYILKTHVLSAATLRIKATRWAQLSGIVVAVFAVSYGPFIYHGQLRQLLARIFPTEGRLLSSYWAPNIWAFYGFADELLRSVCSKFGYEVGSSSITRGLTQHSRFAVLSQVPNVVPAALTAVFTVPSLYLLFVLPSQNRFLYTVIYCEWVSFWVGVNVHGQDVLVPLLGLFPLAIRKPKYAGIFITFSTVGHWSLFPLLPAEEILFIRIALVLPYAFYLHYAVIALTGERAVPILRRICLYGLGTLFIYTEVMSKVILSRYEFLPLMATSVYSALWISCCFLSFFAFGLLPRAPEAKK